MNRCAEHLRSLAYQAGFKPRFARLAMAALFLDYSPCRSNAKALRFAARRIWAHEVRNLGVQAQPNLNNVEYPLCIAACEWARARHEEDAPCRWAELVDAARKFARQNA